MLRALSVESAPQWDVHAAIDVVALDYDARHRRRMMMTANGGTVFLLDLEEATTLNDGDGLVLEDGTIIQVKAAPERLAEIRCESAPALTRIAWHLGNRHCPTQLLGDCLRIREDHVLIDMVKGLGAEVCSVTAAFQPERGAYSAGHTHGNAGDD